MLVALAVKRVELVDILHDYMTMSCYDIALYSDRAWPAPVIKQMLLMHWLMCHCVLNVTDVNLCLCGSPLFNGVMGID